MELFIPVVAALAIAGLLLWLLGSNKKGITRFLKRTTKSEEIARRLSAPDLESVFIVEREIKHDPELESHFQSFTEDEKRKIAALTLGERADYFAALKAKLSTADENTHTSSATSGKKQPAQIAAMYARYKNDRELMAFRDKLIAQAEIDFADDPDGLKEEKKIIHNAYMHALKGIT